MDAGCRGNRTYVLAHKAPDAQLARVRPPGNDMFTNTKTTEDFALKRLKSNFAHALELASRVGSPDDQ